MDLDRESQRRSFAVASGWDPAINGGYGWGGAPAAAAATRTVPNLPVTDVPALPEGGYGGGPGHSGGSVRFRNLAPRTRRERRNLTNKEALEKARLRERTGGFHKYSDPGKLVSAEDASSAMFVSEQERFVTDVALDEKMQRERAYARNAAAILQRREREAEREEERWKRMEEEKAKEEERVRELQRRGTKARRNKGSEPYDLVTQAYTADAAGARLRYQDDMTKYRAAMRAQFLQEKARGAEFDILSGTAQHLMDLPARPLAPPELGTKPSMH